MLAIAAGLAWRVAVAWPVGDAARPYAAAQEEYFLSSALLRARGVYSVDLAGSAQTTRGPLFTTFLTLAQLGGSRPSPRAARLALALLGACTALAAWGLGARLRSPLAGSLAAAFVSLDPSLVASVRDFDVHGFYGAVVVLLAVASANWAEKKGDRLSGNLLGLALGASLLCRSAHFLAVPLLGTAAVAWWGRDGLRRFARVLLVAAAVLAPWTLRNYAHTRRVVPLDAGVGAYNLLAAAGGGDRAVTYDEAFALADRLEPGFAAARRDEPEPVRDAAVLRLALRTIASSPLDYARGCARRLAGYWLPVWPLLLLAAFAVVGAGRGIQATALIAASFCAYAGIGLGEGYRLGVEPLLAALAGIGAAGFLRSSQDHGTAPARAPLPLAAAAGAALAATMALLPGDALASRRPWTPDCQAPEGFLAAFLADGLRLAGERWYLAAPAASLRARPEVCAGMAAFESGDAKEAARHFDAAASIAPHDPEIRVDLAVALAAAGQMVRALRECNEAATLAADPRVARSVRESINSTRSSLRSRLSLPVSGL